VRSISKRPHVNLLIDASVRKVVTKSVTHERIICESIVYLPSSQNPHLHVESANLEVVDLTEEEIAELKEIDKTHHFRVCPPDWTGWGNLGFTD
jgi:diketogulonate reductase-like aldo/keto reductase